jgi:hypothetical protein
VLLDSRAAHTTQSRLNLFHFYGLSLAALMARLLNPRSFTALKDFEQFVYNAYKFITLPTVTK